MTAAYGNRVLVLSLQGLRGERKSTLLAKAKAWMATLTTSPRGHLGQPDGRRAQGRASRRPRPAVALGRVADVVLVVFVVLAACGSDSKNKTLSNGDVTGLPSGSADGTSFSGTYVIADSSVEGCYCRRGPCSGWRASSGNQLVVKQNNGALEIIEKNSLSSDPCLGGIDKDGKFWCGQSYSADDFSLLSLWEGTAVAAESLDVVSELTLVGTIYGQYYDCDVQGHFRAPYVGP